MANLKQIAILKQGVKAWNKWQFENAEIRLDLQGADLREANLSGARFNGADLREADLFRANLSGADLSGADLSRAILCGADLQRWANLINANLSEANLAEANLYSAFLERANLSGADLSWARLIRADLREANLSGANLVIADLREAVLSKANLSGADLRAADLFRANLSGADLSGADLSNATLVKTQLSAATMTAARVYGTSVWDVETDGDTKQTGLIITPKEEPAVLVDDIEVAQFIYLLLNRKKLRNVLDAMTQKGVLILGRFKDGGLEVLQAVADRVRELGYLPMLFDFKPSKSRDFTETVKTMVGLARFVIADLSGPSVLKELEATVPNFEVPFIPIIQEGLQAPSMTSDLSKFRWFRWPPVIFANGKMLVEMLPEAVITPAEELGKKREERRAKLFPSRSDR